MHPSRARILAGFAIALTLGMTACTAPTSVSNAVTSVTIDGGDRTIAVGQPLTLTATVATTGNASDAVAWTSSDESVAIIGADGQVTSLADGPTDLTATSVFDPTKDDTVTLTVGPASDLRWARQFGSTGDDVANGVATDANGNVYVAGQTSGGLQGTNVGGMDAYVRAYDADGTLRWTRQFGTIANDLAHGVATDAIGNVFVAGATLGDLGSPNEGDHDVFVRAYDGDGNVLWTRRFGTSAFDEATGVATDANGNVYVTGETNGDLGGPTAGSADAFLRAYDPDGAELWTRQFGTSTYDAATGVATDANGNVFVSGTTLGGLGTANAGDFDVFLRAYDADGAELWTRQFGTSEYDYAAGVATDATGNVYVSGETRGDLEGPSAGSADAFLRAYDPDGDELWTRQFGTSDYDAASGVATDANHAVYVAGYTRGDLEGPNAGSFDAFLRAFDPDGDDLWTRQIGTSAVDEMLGVATDANGNVNVAGTTFGDLDGSNAGNSDAFVRSYRR